MRVIEVISGRAGELVIVQSRSQLFRGRPTYPIRDVAVRHGLSPQVETQDGAQDLSLQTAVNRYDPRGRRVVLRPDVPLCRGRGRSVSPTGRLSGALKPIGQGDGSCSVIPRPVPPVRAENCPPAPGFNRSRCHGTGPPHGSVLPARAAGLPEGTPQCDVFRAIS